MSNPQCSPPRSRSPSSSRQPVSSTSAVPIHDEDDEEEEICAICYETPTEWGLLDNCTHTFCMDCIISWTTPRGDQNHAEAEAGKTCPSCRTRCQVIVPSEVFLREGDEKKKRIKEYKDAQALIPCEDFVASPRTKKFCPRGRDCLHSHTLPTGETFTFTHTYHDTLLLTQRQSDALAARALFLQILQGNFSRGGLGGGNEMERMLSGLQGEREEVIRLVMGMLAEAFEPDVRGRGRGRATDPGYGMGVGVPDGDSDEEYDSEYDSEEEEDDSEEEEEEDSQEDSQDDSDAESSSWESTDSAASLPGAVPRTPAPPTATATAPSTNANPLRRPIHPRLAAARAHQPAPTPPPAPAPEQRDRMLRDDELEEDDLPELEGIDSDSDVAPPRLPQLGPARTLATSSDEEEAGGAPLDPAVAAMLNEGNIVTSEPQRVTGEELEMLMGMERETMRRRRRDADGSDSEEEEEEETESEDGGMPDLEGISSSESESSPPPFPRRPLPSRPRAHPSSSSENDSDSESDQGPNVFVDHHRPMTAEEEELRRDVQERLGRAFGAFGAGGESDSEEEQSGSEEDSDEDSDEEGRTYHDFEDEEEMERERLRTEALERSLDEFNAWGRRGEEAMPALETAGSSSEEDEEQDSSEEDVSSAPDPVPSSPSTLSSTSTPAPPIAFSSTSTLLPPPPATTDSPLDERRRMAEERARAADERARKEVEERWEELD